MNTEDQILRWKQELADAETKSALAWARNDQSQKQDADVLAEIKTKNDEIATNAATLDSSDMAFINKSCSRRSFLIHQGAKAFPNIVALLISLGLAMKTAHDVTISAEYEKVCKEIGSMTSAAPMVGEESQAVRSYNNFVDRLRGLSQGEMSQDADEPSQQYRASQKVLTILAGHFDREHKAGQAHEQTRDPRSRVLTATTGTIVPPDGSRVGGDSNRDALPGSTTARGDSSDTVPGSAASVDRGRGGSKSRASSTRGGSTSQRWSDTSRGSGAAQAIRGGSKPRASSSRGKPTSRRASDTSPDSDASQAVRGRGGSAATVPSSPPVSKQPDRPDRITTPAKRQAEAEVPDLPGFRRQNKKSLRKQD